MLATAAVGPGFAQESGDPPPQKKPERKVDLYLSGHAMAFLPQDKDLTVGGAGIQGTDIRGTFGVGMKFEAYPWFTNKILGGEVEAFGLWGSVRAPLVTSGAGSSMGLLYDASIQGGGTALSGSSGSLAFAYQFLGGLKTFVTKRLFLFGEYKYFVTKYSWDADGAGDSKVKLDLQTHLISGGVGWSF